MGHYNDSYEYAADQKFQDKRRQSIKLVAELDTLFEKLESVMRRRILNNHPFRTCLYDLQKEYIAWQYEEGLIIKDPQILIDILKDEEN